MILRSLYLEVNSFPRKQTHDPKSLYGEPKVLPSTSTYAN